MLEEILIVEIRNRPCLWDHRIDVQLRGPEATKQAWEEISAIMGNTALYIYK